MLDELSGSGYSYLYHSIRLSTTLSIQIVYWLLPWQLLTSGHLTPSHESPAPSLLSRVGLQGPAPGPGQTPAWAHRQCLDMIIGFQLHWHQIKLDLPGTGCHSVPAGPGLQAWVAAAVGSAGGNSHSNCNSASTDIAWQWITRWPWLQLPGTAATCQSGIIPGPELPGWVSFRLSSQLQWWYFPSLAILPDDYMFGTTLGVRVTVMLQKMEIFASVALIDWQGFVKVIPKMFKISTRQISHCRSLVQGGPKQT